MVFLKVRPTSTRPNAVQVWFLLPRRQTNTARPGPTPDDGLHNLIIRIFYYGYIDSWLMNPDGTLGESPQSPP
jgi:hypothetical protein